MSILISLTILLFAVTIFFGATTILGRRTGVIGLLLIPLIVFLYYSYPGSFARAFKGALSRNFIVQIITDYQPHK